MHLHYCAWGTQEMARVNSGLTGIARRKPGGARPPKVSTPTCTPPLSALKNARVNGGSVEFGRRMAESLGNGPDHHRRAGPLWRHPSRSEDRANTIAQRHLSDPSRTGLKPDSGRRQGRGTGRTGTCPGSSPNQGRPLRRSPKPSRGLKSAQTATESTAFPPGVTTSILLSWPRGMLVAASTTALRFGVGPQTPANCREPPLSTA